MCRNDALTPHLIRLEGLDVVASEGLAHVGGQKRPAIRVTETTQKTLQNFRGNMRQSAIFVSEIPFKPICGGNENRPGDSMLRRQAEEFSFKLIQRGLLMLEDHRGKVLVELKVEVLIFKKANRF